MDKDGSLRRVSKAFGTYAAAVLLSILVLALALRLWNLDLRVPFAYSAKEHGTGCDGLSFGMLIKSVIDTGWYLHNDFVGAPHGLDMHDYPLADGLHFLVLKLIGLCTGDYAVTYNLYFLLTFPLTAVSALFVFRRFQISYPSALVASLLFTFLPCHFWRGSAGHLFLASYYLIPLTVMVVLWVYQGKVPRLSGATDDPAAGAGAISRCLASGAVCALVAFAGIYYAAFACLFLLLAGFAACLHHKKASPLIASTVLIGTVVVGVFVQLYPTLSYRREHGPNPQAVVRAPEGAEIGVLKITQLLLPVTGHRIMSLADFKTRYNCPNTPLINENDFSTLGVVASAGFLFLLVQLLNRRPADPDTLLPEGLSMLNVFAVLVAVLGGFGALFAWVVTAWIKTHNRISVYIAFFSLFAVALLLDALRRRCAHSWWTRTAFYGLAGLVLVVGLWDQNSRHFPRTFRCSEEEYRSDAEFVQRIEASLPVGALIFQLPCTAFPESGTIHRMKDYDLFRGYLHSKTLRWSYGGMRGRTGDAWYCDLASQPLNCLVRRLALVGFHGIYLNRTGYPDRGAGLEAELTYLLGADPLVSRDGQLSFFNLIGYRAGLMAQSTKARWEQERRAALHPTLVLWSDGFYPLDTWRWCSSEGRLFLVNLSDQARDLTLSMSFWSPYAEPAGLQIDGPLFSAQCVVSDQDTAFRRTVTVPPGKHEVRFRYDGKRVIAPLDPRKLYFRIKDFHVAEAVSTLPAAVSPTGEKVP